MNSSSVTEDELLKENKTKNDKAADSNKVEVREEFEDDEGLDNPDDYHK